MLITCPECELQVSDKASACPHCGYPMAGGQKRKPRSKNNKRRRLPNGFGQISEIKNRNLRNPFRAMVTVGKDENGRPVCKPLKPESYFPTYNDAYAALVEYNRNPYDLKPEMTMSELYDKWSEEYFKTLKQNSSQRTISSCWAYCSSVYKMRVSDLRARHIKGCMEEGFVKIKDNVRRPTAGVKSRIKSMFNLMLDYAVEYELIDRNYARTFSVSDDIIKEQIQTKRDHISFTDEEMQKLWDNLYVIPYVDVILIQCYSGWRPQELGLIEVVNIDFEKNIIVGGMKTDAGSDRIVPIHPKILPLIKKRYDEAVAGGAKYLITCTDGVTHKENVLLTYEKYRGRFLKVVKLLNLNPLHRAHDARVYFVTKAKKYGVDEYAIKYIVGHQIEDLTERVYTRRDTEWLNAEIQKIV